MQAEMPDLRIGAGLRFVPDTRARHRNVEHRKFHDLGRPLRGVRIGHHHADVAADEVDARRAELVNEGADVTRHRRLVVAAERLVGFARAAVIDRDDPIPVFGECRHHVTPRVPGLRPAVQQDHHLAVVRAAGHVMESDVVELRVASAEAPLETGRQARRRHPWHRLFGSFVLHGSSSVAVSVAQPVDLLHAPEQPWPKLPREERHDDPGQRCGQQRGAERELDGTLRCWQERVQ